MHFLSRLHPSELNPYVPGAHRSHLLPTTFFLHGHSPVYLSQRVDSDPVGSHSHGLFRPPSKVKYDIELRASVQFFGTSPRGTVRK